MFHNDNWDDCPWDAGEVRLLVRGLAKCLIQARWLTEPDFLPADQVNAWFPPDGAEVSSAGRTTQTLLGHAVTNARRLQAIGFLPEVWYTSATLVPGPEVAGELVSAVHSLLAGDLENDNPVAALFVAARQPDQWARWVRLVDWDVLRSLPPLLDQFPTPKPRQPVVVPHWDPDAGELRYGQWVARKVAASAQNIRTLLDAFAVSGWPPKIASPFPGSTSVVHETLKRLRQGLVHITFRSERGGTEVCWAPVPSRHEAEIG